MVAAFRAPPSRHHALAGRPFESLRPRHGGPRRTRRLRPAPARSLTRGRPYASPGQVEPHLRILRRRRGPSQCGAHRAPQSRGLRSPLEPGSRLCALQSGQGSRSVEDFLAHRPERLATVLQQIERLGDAAAMNAVSPRLTEAVSVLGRPVRGWSGRLTEKTRGLSGLAKTHTLDALSVGHLDHAYGDRIVRFAGQVLVAKATGRGSYARTTPDRYGISAVVPIPRQATLRIRDRRPRTCRGALRKVRRHVDSPGLGARQGAAQHRDTSRADQRVPRASAAASAERRLCVRNPCRAGASAALKKGVDRAATRS